MEPMPHATVSLVKSWKKPRTVEGELAPFGKDLGCVSKDHVGQDCTGAATALSKLLPLHDTSAAPPPQG